MKNKEKLVGIIMAVIMSIINGLLFAFIARKTADAQSLASMPPATIMYITSLLESLVIGVAIMLIFPIGMLGRALAGKFGANPPSMKFNLLNSIPLAVINAVVVSALCSFLSIAKAHSNIPAGQAPPLFMMWFGSWIKLLPLSIIVSYILSILLAPVVVRAVGAGGPPAGAGGPPTGAGSPADGGMSQ